MIKIDSHLECYIKEKFPKRIVASFCPKGSWNTSRWIYVTSIQEKNKEIHYEFIFKEMMAVFDPLIEKALNADGAIQETETYHGEPFDKSNSVTEDVRLETCVLGRVLSNNLVIPDYQRNYCWEDRQIQSLWDSICRMDKEVHLGTIILQRNESGAYEVIDGQQRLVTLTLICQALRYRGKLSLLEQTFRSEKSKRYISAAKWLIQQLDKKDIEEIEKILKNVLLSVLILRDGNLELAYTFFTNENSKGVPLSDYDLLKAHHLRFIAEENQAEHLATLWNVTISSKRQVLEAVLGVHLLRLRKWMRREPADSNRRFTVRDEYSSSATVPEIPPFGERFNFYEKIQGGSHFFAYVDCFVSSFVKFSQTRPVYTLRKQLTSGVHWRYGSVIETLLFGYFMKFGEQYLSEALFCIASFIAQHRYLTERALSYKIDEYAMNSEIVMMLDQSSLEDPRKILRPSARV